VAKKYHLTQKYLGLRTSVMAVASCLAFSGMPLVAQAAGLGKVVVFSALGQPLRAEIEITATREELSGMKAQLASPDAFKLAGLDYAGTLMGISFSLDKRANGQPVIKLSSERPINDPFIDMLLELNWPTGRLVREYTFLLDPPEMATKGSVPVAPAMIARPETVAGKPPVTARATSSIDDEVRGKAVARIRTPEPAPAPAQQADQSAQGREVHLVKRGDSLSKIAGATKPEGVSLEQMLVALLRANQEAFDGGNMNRLKAGKILTLPEKSAIEAVSAGEARKVVVAQSADWNAYRNKLAGIAAQAPVKEGAARQESAGKISARVEDKATPAVDAKDQLKVSKTVTDGSKAGVLAKRSDEDLIAKEKALKEAKERLASLEKNVVDLQKLVELKNQNLAELQKQASTKAVPVAAIKPPEAKPPVPAPVAAAIEKPAEKAAETKPPEPAAVAKPEPKAEEAAKPAEAPKPVAAAKPKPVLPPPPPPEEPGFVEELLDNPLALAGGGGILALIAAYFVSRRRRGGKIKEVPLDASSTLSPQVSSLTANSVFRSTGGQSVDTSHTPDQTDFSQAGPGSIDTDEVDPVAEADVYMAYGRDVQAEEILLEAKQKDSKRYAIHLKLLEIYLNRKDTKQFETLASDLYSETGGVGADWEKAAAMGLKLDQANPLFSNSAPSAPASFDADATLIVAPPSVRNTVTLPGELSQLAEVASTSEPPADLAVADEGVSAAATDLTSLDFDLGLGDDKPAGKASSVTDEALNQPDSAAEAAALDFDLAAPNDNAAKSASADVDVSVGGMDFSLPEISSTATPDSASGNEVADLDFDLGIGSNVTAGVEPVVQAGSDVASEPKPDDDSGLEFDVSLTESTFLGSAKPEAPSFNMASIDLDLKAADPAAQPKAAAPADTAADFDAVQVSTSVNPDFETMQSETLVNPQFGQRLDQPLDNDFTLAQSATMIHPHFGGGLDQAEDRDFSTAQAETVVNPQFGVEQDLSPEFETSSSEEVTTKLDLAKAYEEMGDLEGARELLQEVVKEGNASQREMAQAILSKISV